MASKTRKPGRTLTTLAVLFVLGVLALTLGHFTQGATFTPKLAADLEGGTQLILTPRLQEGVEDREVSPEDMNEAIRIIRQRVDASGVAEAEITTLGTDNIVVTIPGEADENILELVRSSALMRFRPVILASNSPYAYDPEAAAQSLQSGDDAQSADMDADAIMEAAVAELVALGEGQEQDNHSSYAWITPEVARDFLLLDCTNPESLTQDEVDDPAEPYAACDVDGTAKYLLGPVDVEGTHLVSASAGSQMTSAGQPTGKYAVNLQFDSEGAEQFAETSKRLYAFNETDPSRNSFATVLDGNVIVAATMNGVILDGSAQITGNYTAAEAQSVANSLKFGSLPLNFEVQSEQQISATLGSSHLEKGLWAGAIGLGLVVLFMIWQYRGLAVLSAGSLVVAAAIVYLLITILSWTMGYRLSLPGVAGLIVAIGFTADSFIVYFERIRDEIREGRPLQTAVEEGWDRAKRTILISDTVNLVAAIVLYLLAVGGVQGFAFTLGLTTLVDLLVVFMFTHPTMELLIRTRFFGSGHKLSGLDPEHLGASSGFVYMGRGSVKLVEGKKAKSASEKPAPAAQSKREPISVSPVIDGEEQLSLAERRRKARLAAEMDATSSDIVDEATEGAEANRG